MRRPAIMAAITTLPDASANARCSWASRTRNSAGVRSAASIASSTACAASVERSLVVGERLDDCGLEHQPGLHDVVERKAAGGDLQPQEGGHSALRGGDDDGAGCRSRAGTGADQSHHLEHAQRLAHARASDAERRGEFALTGQTVARRETAVEQVGLDALEHHLPGARRRPRRRSSRP